MATEEELIAKGWRPGYLELKPGDLTAASCLACRAPVQHWPHGFTEGRGPGLLFDREEFRGDHLLSLHPCGLDLSAEDLDDPDHGWIEDE